MKILYLGPEGSYSSIAAKYWKNEQLNHDSAIELVAKKSFQDIFSSIQENPGYIGIIPIENSITSNINENIDHLFSQKYTIVGELLLHINLHLFTLKKSNIGTITQVLSHPKALEQSQSVIVENKWETIPTTSTANAAQQVANSEDTHRAAIGPKNLTTYYPDLTLQKENVGDEKYNYTRFVAVTNTTEKLYHQKDTKATFIFTVPHKPGGLVEVLVPLSAANINVTKIESRPIPKQPGNYSFWIEIETQDSSQLRTVEKLIKIHSQSYTLLGTYESAKTYES